MFSPTSHCLQKTALTLFTGILQSVNNHIRMGRTPPECLCSLSEQDENGKSSQEGPRWRQGNLSVPSEALLMDLTRLLKNDRLCFRSGYNHNTTSYLLTHHSSIHSVTRRHVREPDTADARARNIIFHQPSQGGAQRIMRPCPAARGSS